SCITGSTFDGTRIILVASPWSMEEQEALTHAEAALTEEWESIEADLRQGGYPHKLTMRRDDSYLPQVSDETTIVDSFTASAATIEIHASINATSITSPVDPNQFSMIGS